MGLASTIYKQDEHSLPSQEEKSKGRILNAVTRAPMCLRKRPPSAGGNSAPRRLQGAGPPRRRVHGLALRRAARLSRAPGPCHPRLPQRTTRPGAALRLLLEAVEEARPRLGRRGRGQREAAPGSQKAGEEEEPPATSTSSSPNREDAASAQSVSSRPRCTCFCRKRVLCSRGARGRALGTRPIHTLDTACLFV